MIYVHALLHVPLLSINLIDLSYNYRFPPSSHPIIALKGAPASFPVNKRNRHLQKYLVWNEVLIGKAKDYWTNTMNERKFIAVHLRIGTDWVCKHCINEAYGVGKFRYH